MTSFLFWNLQGRREANRVGRTANLLACLARLVRNYEPDVLVFAECLIEPDDVIAALNSAAVGNYNFPRATGQRIRIFTRLHEASIREVFVDRLHDRMTIRELQAEGALPIFLAGLHFHDRMSISAETGRALAVTGLARDIMITEDGGGHSRTVLVGDLNMNPYEAGVVGTQAFHAVMTRRLARSVRRLRDRETYPCFYNPMWSCFGDFADRPPGTYFYPPGLDPVNPFWNMYDQVLVRPDLMDLLSRVEVLDTDGEERLTTRQTGRPRRDLLSDHLPLLFELNLTQGDFNG
jgi:hypothetical protein